jgi:hypothetical protein
VQPDVLPMPEDGRVDPRGPRENQAKERGQEVTLHDALGALLIRKEHVLCTRCGEMEPINPGHGTPAPAFISAVTTMAILHLDCCVKAKKGGQEMKVRCAKSATCPNRRRCDHGKPHQYKDWGCPHGTRSPCGPCREIRKKAKAK